MKLTLWTTKELQDVMNNFYIKFIKEIEKIIMKCENWEAIKSLIEDVIDSGTYKFSKYIKYIYVKKKRKNIKIHKKYDKKYNAYKLILLNDMSDTEIKEFCRENKFPDYVCINQINVMNKEEFIENYGTYKPIVPRKIDKLILNIENKENKKYILEYCKKILPECINYSVYIPTTNNMNRKIGINTAIETNKEYNFANRCKVNNIMIINYEDESYCHLVGITEQKKLPDITYDIKKLQYSVEDTIVKYSIIKEEYENKMEDPTILDKYILPDNYYWKSPDGWLFLHKKDKSDIVSLKILNPKNIIERPIETPVVNVALNEVVIPAIPVLNREQTNSAEVIVIINSDVKLFVDMCIKKTDNKRLRIGIVEIYNKYKSWCETNTKIKLIRNEFKNEFTKLSYKEESVRGIDINNKPHKKGYNLSMI